MIVGSLKENNCLQEDLSFTQNKRVVKIVYSQGYCMGVCQGYSPILWAHSGSLECEMEDLCQMEALKVREKKISYWSSIHLTISLVRMIHHGEKALVVDELNWHVDK